MREWTTTGVTQACDREIVRGVRAPSVPALVFCLWGALSASACRPVVRACSSSDRCAAGSSCVGGRCEPAGRPTALADSARIVLVPTRSRFVTLGGRSALLLQFELPDLPADALVEAHLLVHAPAQQPGWARVFRMNGRWHERSTSAADALGNVGPLESETRRLAAAPDRVRLHLSRDGLLRQRELGWAVQLEPAPSETDGIRLAETSDDGPRLELYLRESKASPALTSGAPTR